MAKYRKKPVVIEAFQWTKDKVPQWWLDASGKFNMNIDSGNVYIKNRAGTYVASKNDWILKDEDGDIYPCKLDIFEKTYELVTE